MGFCQVSTFQRGSNILLSKPANPEQVQIALQLDRHNAVLVQGPPGTGKTHTIANLIGHLLAQGKSVLVTSHTAKALRVLHGQIATQLQPLCVSVLGRDADNRETLERAVAGMAERLSGGNGESLAAEAERLDTRRSAILVELAKAQNDLRCCIEGEYGGDCSSGNSLWTVGSSTHRRAWRRVRCLDSRNRLKRERRCRSL